MGLFEYVFPEIMPKNYPFLFNNEKEQKEIIKKILTKQYTNEYLNNIKKELQKHCKKEYNNKKIAQEIQKLINEKYTPIKKQKTQSIKNKHQQKIQNIIQQNTNKETNMTELYNQIRKETKLGSQAFSNQKYGYITENTKHTHTIKNKKIYITIKE